MRERSTDANLKTVRAMPTFSQIFTHSLAFSQITIGHIDLQYGECVAQQNADVGFSQVPIVSDQTIEQTLNRHTKIGGARRRQPATGGSAEVDADSTRAPLCSADTLLPRASQC